MIILLEDIEKETYRSIEIALFDKEASNPEMVIKKSFKNVERFEYEKIGYEEFFEKLLSKFKETYPQFCISTAFNKEPIFLFDLKKDTIKEYLGIMNYPKAIKLKSLPDQNVGLSITNEKNYFYNPDQNWCLYADRYNDLALLFY